MRSLTILFTLLLANSATAHPGHVEQAAGHNHWIGVALIALAAVVAALTAARAKKNAAAKG